MLRWLGPSRKAPEPSSDGQADLITINVPTAGGSMIPSVLAEGGVTDDPLAVLDTHQHKKPQIYSVSRVNPIFQDTPNCHLTPNKPASRQRSPNPGEKSSSSGYGGSNGCSTVLDQLYLDQAKLREDAVTILEQNQNFVKSIKIASKTSRNRSIPSSGSGSSGGGTLTTIPEGRVDLPVPKPIWPRERDKGRVMNYDSLVDDALLLYTSLNYLPDNNNIINNNNAPDQLELSVREILVELLNSINATIAGSNGSTTPEEILKTVNEKIASSIEILKMSTEEEMKKLCINLSNCRKINSVLKAFSNSRIRTESSDTEDFYHIPSGSSSSGFSDANNALPVFVHDDLGSVPNGVRNAMIYGTLCRTKSAAGGPQKEKKNSLQAVNDNRPSVWEQYYGVRAAPEGKLKYEPKPTDVPLYPGGRPEADFTLDLPRSEMLSKRMKEDKKWRCRCRLLTSFLGLVFFLLSVMAVSLMLTRGKRMFGSMM